MCPFGEPVGPPITISVCPLYNRGCHCVEEMLLFAAGDPDHQALTVTKWWHDNNTAACADHWERATLPEFAPVCVICGEPGAALCEEHR
jgi:hypothetical protein